MKLYVCWGTFSSPRPGGHPCKNAHDALTDAGYDPEVIKSYGWTALPDNPFNRSTGRKRAKELPALGGSVPRAGRRHHGRRIEGDRRLGRDEQGRGCGLTRVA